jgi:hypothetical protein
MKATIKKNHFVYVLAIALLFLLFAFINLMAMAAVPSNPAADIKGVDTLKYKAITGKIMDNKTKEPIVFANVYLDGTNIGTVTNSDGEFLLKVPVSRRNANIAITHLGFKNLLLEVAQMKEERNLIYLDPVIIPIEEVIVRFTNAEQLVYHALMKKTDNYSKAPVMLTSFYRETIKQNRNYVAVSEAVLDIYKSPYVQTLETDRSKIYRGRKSQDVKKMDTVLFKLQGGPYNALMLDVVKNPGEVLSAEYLNLYDYTFAGINYIDDRETYIINFKQKSYVADPLYKGTIYIDAGNLAFTGIDFNLNINDPELVNAMFIRKKPIGMKVDVLGASYLTKYRIVDNTWYLNYVRLEASFKCKWDKKLFNSVYSTMTEMAVTDMDMENVNRFKYKESEKITDVLADQVNQFEDPDFWGEYNIIKPDESIEAAIDKISRKLKKRM